MFRQSCFSVFALFVLLSQFVALAQEQVGTRPYEMVWADRTVDTRPPLLDFEDLEGWTVDTQDSLATFERSRREQLWGRHVGRLTYQGLGGNPLVTVRPPEPIAVPGSIDCFNFWIHGNNWGWVTDASTPRVEIRLVLRSAAGQTVRLSMGRVRWKEWWVMHRQLTSAEAALVGADAKIEAIEIAGGRNKQERVLHFDNLSAYQQELPPLEFDPRPQRGIDLPAGQTVGTNTGPGRLPFPTREETILPDNLTDDFRTSLEETDGTFTFHYQGDDGRLAYHYRPTTGTLDDLTAAWGEEGEPFQPMANGGVYFASPDESVSKEPVRPNRAELIDCRRDGDVVRCGWRVEFDDRSAEVTYALRLWGKSLVIDVQCPGGQVAEFRPGRATGLEDPRLVTLPFLTCGQQRPAVLITGEVETPLFLLGLIDYYRSNASKLWAINSVDEEGNAAFASGSAYEPRTDGVRNDCFERFFLTVSPRFEEVLPNVPNPTSPWKAVTSERVWRAHGAKNRESDLAFWQEVGRYGMAKIAITDHETGWRDGGESFTLRTRAAPGKGGDESQADYARAIRGLGFRYGIYNNYTDFAPVNGHWDEDYVGRLSNGEWRPAWPRCYNLKPSRAVELESRLSPVIQEKFQLDTAYCDVHTAVRPWQYTDYDARVPGGGTFAATYYAYGEIMLHQKQTWNGPVYSEGNNHWYYCGLTDGNYGQDQLAGLDVNPWLVDFELRKLHPLCCNFGMGAPGMFFDRKTQLGGTPEERERRLDRFLAATLAFGHTGFLVREAGTEGMIRSYFALQQVAARYAMDTVVDIQYADYSGSLCDTSRAVASGAFRRSQVVSRYSDGLEVTVNGHPNESWTLRGGVVLPPNGWIVRDPEERAIVAFSKLVDGHRADYVDSPAYIFADGRGRFTRFKKAACDGQMIAHRRDGGVLEVIPVGECSTFGVSLDEQTATAEALDKAGQSLGTADTRYSRGLVYIEPVEGAFSYLLTPAGAPEVVLRSYGLHTYGLFSHDDRTAVVPGEKVAVGAENGDARTFHVDPAASPGELLWHEQDGAWIDFSVRPLVESRLTVNDALRLELTSNLDRPTQATVNFSGKLSLHELPPGETVGLDFPLDLANRSERVQRLPLAVHADGLAFERTWWLRAEESIKQLETLPTDFEAGQCIRGGEEMPMNGQTGAGFYKTERSCGDDLRPCLFAHPPYKKGTGYSSAWISPVVLPDEPAALRCEIGKADGSDPGDGILFQVGVVTQGGHTTIAAEKMWGTHAWTPLEVDLTPWAGMVVALKLIVDAGPADNTSGDWACWSNLRLETLRPVLIRTIHDQPVELERTDGPHAAIENLTPELLRTARSAVLHFQGIGLQSSGSYICGAKLNGVSIGSLPSAGGGEAENVWNDASMEIPPEAIASLDEWNHVTIQNTGRDFFKVGRFWMEAELSDGRRASSQVTRTVFTQPPSWPYASGRLVPFGTDIDVEIRWRMAE